MAETIVMVTFLNVEGEVEVRTGNSGWKKAYSGMVITMEAGGVVLRSGEKAGGLMFMSTGGRIPIKPNSLVIVSKPAPKKSDTLPEIKMDVEEVKKGLDALRHSMSMVGVPCC